LKHWWSIRQAEAYFEVAALLELPAAVIETTEVRFGLIVDDLMGAKIPVLGESLPTDITSVRAFSCVPLFVLLKFLVSQDREIEIMFCTYLQVSTLGETPAASGFFAWL
jgi:hypothetical protein